MRALDTLANYVFPASLVVFLTGLFWIGDHGLYSKLFYWIVLLPAVTQVALQPRSVALMFRSRITLAFAAFALYMSFTTLWTSADAKAIELVKRPLYVLALFYVVFEVGRVDFRALRGAVKMSALTALVASAVTLVRFYGEASGGRLAGYGALFNPLLVSHVFGFFLALWLGYYFTSPRLFEPWSLFAIVLCVGLLLSTGSRTPLVAMLATIISLATARANRKSACALGVVLTTGLLAFAIAPRLLLQRGLSYRTDIWTIALHQIADMPWMGHGYGAPLSIQLTSIPYPFSDPHNLTLAVTYAGGVIGLGLWLLLYFSAFKISWHQRKEPWVLTCAATAVYGFVAGMTEGGSFLSRPKEHWFLIWIPLALLAEAASRNRDDLNDIGKKTHH